MSEITLGPPEPADDGKPMPISEAYHELEMMVIRSQGSGETTFVVRDRERAALKRAADLLAWMIANRQRIEPIMRETMLGTPGQPPSQRASDG